ncbi:MAG: Fe-S cluster assembly protein SufD, partial [Flavisolibacter sp.]
MSTLDLINNKIEQLRSSGIQTKLTPYEEKAIHEFNRFGIPTVRNEEWKYTRIGSLFNKEFQFSIDRASSAKIDIDAFRLPEHENASELVFINGFFASEKSKIRSSNIKVVSLEEAASNEYSTIVADHLGNSSKYVRDGIYALNSASIKDGIFIHITHGPEIEPVHIYNITDISSGNILSQLRNLIYVSKRARLQITETYATIGMSESFINQVTEIIVEQDAIVDYYKIQNDVSSNNQVSTAHFRQIGKSEINVVTISLNGGIIRNNLNISLEAEYAEAHMYGLYFLKGTTHIDNHTVADHIKPNCMSNELYKGIVDDNGTAVFNGKIFVQPLAQKTNAFQSNKNILLSDSAGINTKPQLEIFADDVKCSHGCTVGRLDEEGMFYLQSRGISEKIARSLLVHAFAVDILDHIKPIALRNYIDRLISD